MVDGDPLIGQSNGAYCVARIDADHPGAILARFLYVISAVGAIYHLGWIPAPHQDVLAVHPILPLITRDLGAINRWCGTVDASPALVVVRTEMSPIKIEQAPRKMRPIRVAV